MRWPNVKLIYWREIRDQLRDRRTLFTIAVMPMLLYPLMGISLLQVGQLMRQSSSRVWLVNVDSLPSTPPLLTNGQFDSQLADEKDFQLLQVYHSGNGDRDFHAIVEQFQTLSQLENGSRLADQLIFAELSKRKVDAAVYFQPTQPAEDNEVDKSTDYLVMPPIKVYLFFNSTNERSRLAAERCLGVLNRWQKINTEELFRANQIPLELLGGLEFAKADIADKSVVKTAIWSKVLPFVIVIWALTGAFYPAIDLCAGEKERGTFETLLSSPAARSEIALGKLLTVMSFSYITSMLNLLSMSFTGIFVASKLSGAAGIPGGAFGFPPLTSFIWLMIALIPISAFFSAIALAAAAFARSSKEGQYYLVPLMMISMPLMMIPMLPTAQLDFGTSLIPISGLIMLLRHLLEGQYTAVFPYLGPVIIVTLACCWFAVRWVIAQFNSESVLFRPSEHFSVQLWIKSLLRSREELPSLGSAVLCAIIMLVSKFFLGFAIFTPNSFNEFAFQTVVILVAAIAVPAIMMALVMTRNPLRALRIRGCKWSVASAAILLAIMINPMITWLGAWVMYVYPPGVELSALEHLAAKIMADSPGIWALVLVFALAPAVIEELGFRGFILSGLEALRSKWQAIVISSFFFGLAHTVIQQSIITFFVGLVLGVIAIQGRSIIPCILFHLVHNSIIVFLSQAKPQVIESSTLLSAILVSPDGVRYEYGLYPGLAMTVLAVALIAWFLRLNVPSEGGLFKNSTLAQPAANYGG